MIQAFRLAALPAWVMDNTRCLSSFLVRIAPSPALPPPRVRLSGMRSLWELLSAESSVGLTLPKGLVGRMMSLSAAGLLAHCRADASIWPHSLWWSLPITSLAVAGGAIGLWCSAHRKRVRAQIECEAAREEMRHQRHLALALLGAACSAVLTVDASGRVTDLNETTRRLTGYRYGELLGADWVSTLVDPAQQEATRAELARTSGEGGVWQGVVPIVCAGGQRRTVAWRSVRVANDDAGRAAMLLVGAEVSEASLGQGATGTSAAGDATNLLGICAGCKQVRQDDGQWLPLEQYITEQMGLSITHGLCPQCLHRYFPELYTEDGTPRDPTEQ